MKKLLALTAALLWLGGANAIAANTAQVGLSEGAYTDLGAAPVSVQALNGNAWVVVADSLPSLAAGGVLLTPMGPNVPITFQQADASSHVYALATSGPATVAYTTIYAAALGSSVSVTNFPATQPVNGTLASSVGDGVVTGGIASYSVNSGGSGYVAGDVGKTVSLVGGTSPSSTPAQFTIASVSGGAVTAITLANAGVYSAAPSVAAATTGGGTTGSGLVANNSMAPIAQTLFGGTAPANGWKIVNPNASGDIWASDNGVAPVANGASSYRCAAAGGACKTEPGEKPPGSPVQVLGATIGAPFVARRW